MAVATVTFVVANLLGSGGSKVKAISAEAAFAALEEKSNAFLLDIRRRKEASADGTPDIRSTGRKLETLAFSQVWLCFISLTLISSKCPDFVTDKAAFSSCIQQHKNPDGHLYWPLLLQLNVRMDFPGDLCELISCPQRRV